MLNARTSRKGYRQFGDRYPQKTIFVAGLPKSGTTWMERLLSSYPGFSHLLIPEVTPYELATGGSHDYELPEGMFSRFERMLVITKMHVHGSPHNVEVLSNAGVRYSVLYRDLRDVAVSDYFHLHRSKWHPEYPLYSRLSVTDGLKALAHRKMKAYADWVRSWHDNRAPEASLVLKYEQLLADPVGEMTRVAELFELDSSHETVGAIVAANSFQSLSGGRSEGQEDSGSLFRKGVIGDWENHFTPELKELYKERIGDFLVEFGYEDDQTW